MALVEPANTVIETGTVAAALLLVKLTAKPPDGAAALSVTVQVSEPEPVNELLAQFRELRAAGVAEAVPTPLRPTTSAAVDALLVIAT